MGLKYGCPVEDILTGLSVQCRGWISVGFNPERRGFLGVAPTSLLQTLVQHTRWSEGHIQIFLSKYCPLLYGHGKIPLQLQISYCCYNLWAANCLATLFYVIVPPLCLLKDITLFPQVGVLPSDIFKTDVSSSSKN
ncbi:Cellulose synthase-like protein E1 [Forsythia ovata]|uniref:Cellulose synthase-like protein E1 n=1 Tax=Forsythia ovata TaxID=205694 RepID=A0ABD1R644_9LAMI